MEETLDIFLNSIKTPDGTVLVSRSLHDYKEYQDKNGEFYMVDGGSSYLRRSVNEIPYEELSVTSGDSFEEIRKVCSWGTYGLNKDKGTGFLGETPKRVTIDSMSKLHLQAILDDGYKGPIVRMMALELEYRKVRNINIED